MIETSESASTWQVDQALAALTDSIASVRHSLAGAPVAARVDAIAAALRAADELTAVAVDLAQRGGVEATTGLPLEMLLGLEARRTGADARMIATAAEQLRAMPALANAFARGVVSWSQVRAIALAVARQPVSVRSAVDRVVGRSAAALATADPDRLVQLADDEVARHKPRLELAREDRWIERGFLAMQSRLDGGSRIYGEADPESTAIIAEALDAHAPRPHHADDEQPSRARQRFDAFVAICERSLAGETGGTRPRPRLLAIVDANAIAGDARADAMRLLTPLAGRSPRMTSVAADVLACDATVTPVIFDGARPVVVGDVARTVSDKVRTAVIARDGGCRFPDCGAPVSWCDVHHIVPGRGNTADDMMLLCRRCHRRVHRFRWRIRLRPDGAAEFSRAGRTYLGIPNHRAPPERDG